jgi:Predicted restriction endonuclease
MGKKWTDEDTLHVLSYYVSTNGSYDYVPLIAEQLDRTIGSIKMKFGNFDSLNPNKGIGLLHTSKQDVRIWNEYHENWEMLSNFILGSDSYANNELIFEESILEKGLTKERVIKARVNQNVFRRGILNAYSGQCCVTLLSETNLLIASHIKPWSESSPEEKLDIGNGLCLNAFHDKAFDKGLITIDQDYRIQISNKIDKMKVPVNIYELYFSTYDGKRINLPSESLRPGKNYLAYHNECIFLDV